MARKRKKKKIESLNPFGKIADGLEDETKHGVLAVVLLVVAIFLVLSWFGYAGIAGDNTYQLLRKVLGTGFIVLPISFLLLAVSFFKSGRPHLFTTNAMGGLFFLLSSLGIMEILFQDSGGFVGKSVSYLLVKYFDVVAATVFLLAIFFISLLIILNTKFPKISFRKNIEEDAEEEEYEEEDMDEDVENEEYEEEEDDGEEEDEGLLQKVLPFRRKGQDEEEDDVVPYHVIHGTSSSLPPLSLLEKDSGKPGAGDLKANTNIIKRTLVNFGIDVEIDEVSIGPSITRYAIKPAEGVRLSRIVALQNDLALALAAHPVRIEAPIPGKSLVGIEIPNSKKSTVGLATLLSSKEYSERKEPLLITLGKSVTGTPLLGNIAKAPHILIAGATGSGKSVTIHSIITSLLYRNLPQMMRFIMIDPKRVELTLYNGIPHLLTPVITEPKKAILSLKWAIKEMERRYNILEAERVRDIETYHKNVIEPFMENGDPDDDNAPEPMPYIMIVIDELADIMVTYPKELESAIVRLAQMSRAVGIHLILSTQRPSVNVITGLIKANIPSRIALQVSSQIDSRTILDSAGAEKLLGAGDMLYISGEMSKPVRLQSAFVTEQEVKRVVKFLKKEYEDELADDLDLSSVDAKNNILSVDIDSDQDEPDDDLYEDARELVIATKKASTSYLQRKLSIGYARAARIIDILEERGVVGPGVGSKPREVYEDFAENDEEGEEETYEDNAEENEDDEELYN